MKNESLDCQSRGFDALKGVTLKDRFKVLKRITQGSFGRILEVYDLETKERLVMKIQED